MMVIIRMIPINSKCLPVFIGTDDSASLRLVFTVITPWKVRRIAGSECWNLDIEFTR